MQEHGRQRHAMVCLQDLYCERPPSTIGLSRQTAVQLVPATQQVRIRASIPQQLQQQCRCLPTTTETSGLTQADCGESQWLTHLSASCL